VVEEERMTELLVRCSNPEDLDRIVNGFNAAVVQDGSGAYVLERGCCIVRCFGDPGFIRFMIDQQGYGEVLSERLPDSPLFMVE
jgi:hypothetical protein